MYRSISGLRTEGRSSATAGTNKPTPKRRRPNPSIADTGLALHPDHAGARRCQGLQAVGGLMRGHLTVVDGDAADLAGLDELRVDGTYAVLGYAALRALSIAGDAHLEARQETHEVHRRA